MSARVGAFAKFRPHWPVKDVAEPFDQAENAMLEAAGQIDRAASDLKTLNEVLNRVDRNVIAAAKRAVKQAGHSPLRLNSRQARGK